MTTESIQLESGLDAAADSLYRRYGAAARAFRRLEECGRGPGRHSSGVRIRDQLRGIGGRVDERTTGACPAVPVDGPVSVSVHRPNQDLVLMQVRGDVDDAADLARRLTAAATPGADAQVALDLAGVTALSRAGLDAILQAQESLEAGSLELL
jgi:hypothetical protein